MNQQLCSDGEFGDNIRLFTDIVALMRAKKRARGANTHPILYADDLNFAIMLLTELHSEAIILRFWRRFFLLGLFNWRGLLSFLFCGSDLSLQIGDFFLLQSLGLSCFFLLFMLSFKGSFSQTNQCKILGEVLRCVLSCDLDATQRTEEGLIWCLLQLIVEAFGAECVA